MKGWNDCAGRLWRLILIGSGLRRAVRILPEAVWGETGIMPGKEAVELWITDGKRNVFVDGRRLP